MNIIQKQPNPSGAYPPIQSWSGATPPNGYYQVKYGVELSCGGFGTLTVEEGIVTAFTPDVAAWERWKTPAIEKARENKLNSLNGMCSGAIYNGVDIGALHYNFTTTTQTNLETIARRIDSGTAQVLYRADNENEQRIYPSSEIRVVINTKDEWIAINTNYYELLKKWVDREDDRVVLESIHYGSILPDDLMLELSTRMAGVGIDISKYAGMFA